MAEIESANLRDLCDKFHMHIGYCIAEWAELDERLFLIFQSCVGSPEQCAIIYYKIPGLEPRLSLTDEIIRSVFPKTERKSGDHTQDYPHVVRWSKIKTSIEGLLSTRRRIAHHQVAAEMGIRYAARTISLRENSIEDFEDTFTRNEPMEFLSWFSIYMSHGETLRGKLPKVAALKEGDLIEHAELLRSTTNELVAFYRECMATRLGAHPPPSHWLVRERLAGRDKDGPKAPPPQPRS